MATAKKLPSGSWRCLAYSHTKKVRDPKTGKMKDKRIYDSFTSDNPTPQGKREAEAAEALFQVNKVKSPCQKAAGLRQYDAHRSNRQIYYVLRCNFIRFDYSRI